MYLLHFFPLGIRLITFSTCSFRFNPEFSQCTCATVVASTEDCEKPSWSLVFEFFVRMRILLGVLYHHQAGMDCLHPWHVGMYFFPKYSHHLRFVPDLEDPVLEGPARRNETSPQKMEAMADTWSWPLPRSICLENAWTPCRMPLSAWRIFVFF